MARNRARKPMIPGNGRNGRDCPPNYVPDCSGDGNCCPEEWIVDGWCDGADQQWGCDLTCYDFDGYDCCDNLVLPDDCENNLCNGNDWMNTLGLTCADYEADSANCCLPPLPSDLSLCGTSAQEACCVCGGGCNYVDECGVCNGPGPPCRKRMKRLDPITRQRGGRIRRQQGGGLPKPWGGK